MEQTNESVWSFGKSAAHQHLSRQLTHLGLSESTFLTNADEFPKQQCFLEVHGLLALVLLEGVRCAYVEENESGALVE